MKRKSFTLLELLAAMTVMTLVAGMLTVALASANADAKVNRARGQIQQLNQVLLNLYEEEAGKRLPIQYETLVGAGASPVKGFTLRRASDAALMKLTASREYLRLTMPDRRSDVLLPPAKVRAPLSSASGGYDQGNPNNVLNLSMSFANVSRLRYLNRLARLMNLPTTATPADVANGWSDTHESSECLYLILATSTIDGSPALDGFRAKDIRDTDGDGVPEILDPWEHPIAWIRWPCGYSLTYGIREEPDVNVRTNSIAAKRAEQGNDQLDVMQSDWGMRSTTIDDTYNVLPLIVSAGPDGEFDLLFSPSFLTYPSGYGAMTWPSLTLPGSPYINPYSYPDPYCRRYATYDYLNSYSKYDSNAVNGLVGAYYDSNADQEDQSADNLFSLAP